MYYHWSCVILFVVVKCCENRFDKIRKPSIIPSKQTVTFTKFSDDANCNLMPIGM